jgi:hypothetical protein
MIPTERRFKIAKIFRHLGITPVEPSKREGTLRIWISNVPGPDRRRRNTDINGRMLDSSKSDTARLFWGVFGYGYELDPETHQGVAVAKSDANGRIHGRLVTCPLRRRNRLFYSRFLDGPEWRVQFYGKNMCVTRVFRERLNGFPVNRRINGSSEHNVEPAGEFSPLELIRLGKMASMAGMDYGGMDVIRDRDGKIYVIDLNPGPNGPHREAFPAEDWPKVLPVEAALFREAFLETKEPPKIKSTATGHAIDNQGISLPTNPCTA